MSMLDTASARVGMLPPLRLSHVLLCLASRRLCRRQLRLCAGHPRIQHRRLHAHRVSENTAALPAKSGADLPAQSPRSPLAPALAPTPQAVSSRAQAAPPAALSAPSPPAPLSSLARTRQGSARSPPRRPAPVSGKSQVTPGSGGRYLSELLRLARAPRLLPPPERLLLKQNQCRASPTQARRQTAELTGLPSSAFRAALAALAASYWGACLRAEGGAEDAAEEGCDLTESVEQVTMPSRNGDLPRGRQPQILFPSFSAPVGGKIEGGNQEGNMQAARAMRRREKDKQKCPPHRSSVIICSNLRASCIGGAGASVMAGIG
eukprot:3683208-Rhodomonas_salina.1